jgi:hypothetical protein
MLFPRSGSMLEDCKIPNSKHQITNKSQIPILNDLNRFRAFNFGSAFGGFFVWNL